MVELPTLTVSIDHADVLLAFAQAATSPAGDENELVRVRTALVEAMGEAVMVDATAVVADAFKHHD